MKFIYYFQDHVNQAQSVNVKFKQTTELAHNFGRGGNRLQTKSGIHEIGNSFLTIVLQCVSVTI
jgi:hypothetical protein